ncbi:flavodoxin domain-containing protein [Streptomyces sp. NPDC051322]|uniref:flavodoxin domain-containing protein n=1 Tax=Streptomyces sp. NPDC051322 TaxID=3154645 RepID=UPI00344F38E7
MDTIKVLYGTESGNAELVADDIAETFNAAGAKAEVIAMALYDATELYEAGTVVVITSTYGEGELPDTTAPFQEALLAARPDLSGLRFAAFGLGDSTYDTYNNAIAVLSADLRALGAQQVGETGRHDAASGESLTDVAVAWAAGVLGAL